MHPWSSYSGTECSAVILWYYSHRCGAVLPVRTCQTKHFSTTIWLLSFSYPWTSVSPPATDEHRASFLSRGHTIPKIPFVCTSRGDLTKMSLYFNGNQSQVSGHVYCTLPWARVSTRGRVGGYVPKNQNWSGFPLVPTPTIWSRGKLYLGSGPQVLLYWVFKGEYPRCMNGYHGRNTE